MASRDDTLQILIGFAKEGREDMKVLSEKVTAITTRLEDYPHTKQRVDELHTWKEAMTGRIVGFSLAAGGVGGFGLPFLKSFIAGILGH